MTLRLCDTQWPNSGLFLQNALVEYIGVYSDTNENKNTHESERVHVWFINVAKNSIVLIMQIITLYSITLLCDERKDAKSYMSHA